MTHVLLALFAGPVTMGPVVTLTQIRMRAAIGRGPRRVRGRRTA